MSLLLLVVLGKDVLGRRDLRLVPARAAAAAAGADAAVAAEAGQFLLDSATDRSLRCRTGISLICVFPPPDTRNCNMPMTNTST